MIIFVRCKNYNFRACKEQIRLCLSFAYVPSSRVATKIFEDFGGALNKAFIRGREPLLIVHYTRPGTCINRPLHQAWIQYQAAHPKLISYTTPCKLACCLPRKQLHNHESSIGGSPPKSSKILRCNSAPKCQIKLTVIISGCSFSCFMF